MSEAVDGLAAVLAKHPIIPTFKARDFWDSPAGVEAAYEQHVRSYIPLAREAGADAADDDAPDRGADRADVADFERRLTRAVKEARAPLGYIAAEYGHGKTSTGLFLWDRARADRLLAVPPFSFDAMDDLLTAAAGWVAYAAERVHPGAAERARASYDRYRRQDLETYARRQAERTGRPVEAELDVLRELERDGRFRAGFSGLDYVNCLAELTDLARDAGFQGLLIVLDEVQQYVERQDVRSAREPLADLFDLINTVFTRQGRLACGLILLLPNKELGFINETRGDLINRVKAQGFSLNLAQVYGRDFAVNLWRRLAEEFHFRAEADRVITDDALRALGEISLRPELASGPRTVVDVFKIACQRFQAGAAQPFGLLDLVRAFERGDIAFDGTSLIATAVRTALAHDLVRGQPDRARAVRLMAAFPTTGLSEELQNREGVRAAVDDLQRLGNGELVALRGGGYDHTGRIVRAGVTLMALQPATQQVSWLKGTIRQFRHNYFLGSELVQSLALDGFATLLTERLFPEPQWKVERELPRTMLTQNRGLLLRGSFQSTARTFPDRLVYCRLLLPGDRLRDTDLPEHDLLLDLHLAIPQDHPTDPRTAQPASGCPGRLEWLDSASGHPGHARLTLNLLHHDRAASYNDLNTGFSDIVAPYDVNPLLNLSLYAHLDAARRQGRIPGSEAPNIVNLFLPALLSAALRDLFPAELGATAEPRVTTAEARFAETLFAMLCQRRYGDRYVTLMASTQWQAMLRAYQSALRQRENPLERSGQESFAITKRDLANLMARANTMLDNLIAALPQLIEVTPRFTGDRPSQVRFTPHPLERRLRDYLDQHGRPTRRIDRRTNAAVAIPVLPLTDLIDALKPDGYREVEIKAALSLLEDRQLVEFDAANGVVGRTAPVIPDLTELRADFQPLEARLALLQPLLEPAFVAECKPYLDQIRATLAPTAPPAARVEARLLGVKRAIDQRRRLLDQALQQRRQALADEARRHSAHTLDVTELVLRLDAAPPPGLFADALTRLRLDYQRETASLAAAITAAADALAGAAKTFAHTDADDRALVAAHRQLTHQIEVLSQARTRRDALRQRTDQYRAAAKLLGEVTDLQARLAGQADTDWLAIGDLVAALGRDVREALVTRHGEALGEVDRWVGRLDQARQALAQIEQRRRQQFEARQTMLRAVLAANLRLSADRLWLPVSYNTADPSGSYHLLAERFQQQVQATAESAREGILRRRRQAIELRSPENLAWLAEAERPLAEQTMREMQARLDGMVDQLNEHSAKLMLLASDGDEAQLEAALRALIGALGPLYAHASTVESLAREIDQLRRQHQANELTPEEQQADGILVDLARRHTGGVDFAELRDQLEQLAAPTTAWDEATVWDVLQRLRRKRRVRIAIEPLAEP